MILVTGGAGFVGGRLCARLVADGHQVVSLDNYFAGTTAVHVAGVDYRRGLTHDIARLVPETPTAIFHLGEYSRVGMSFREPEMAWGLNVPGTAAVVHYWYETRAKLIYTGSSTRWGDAESPYSHTKRVNAELIKATGEALGLRYAIAYLCNVYGPGERGDRYGTLIARFRHQRARGQALTVTLPGTQRRNFTHVDDVVDGLMRVWAAGQGDGYVLGCRESWSVLDVAAMFGGDHVLGRAAPGDRSNAPIDTAKAEALGWFASRSLPDYVREVAHAPLPANRFDNQRGLHVGPEPDPSP
jgi:UDP-glucose 4-epimerase